MQISGLRATLLFKHLRDKTESEGDHLSLLKTGTGSRLVCELLVQIDEGMFT